MSQQKWVNCTFFLKFFLYSLERQILFGLIEHYVPNFPRINKKLKLDLILRGVNIDDKDFYHTNTILTKAVQNFIISTKRFASNDKWSQPPQNLKSCALLFIVFFPICIYFQLFIIAYIINQFVIVWNIGKRS